MSTTGSYTIPPLPYILTMDENGDPIQIGVVGRISVPSTRSFPFVEGFSIVVDLHNQRTNYEPTPYIPEWQFRHKVERAFYIVLKINHHIGDARILHYSNLKLLWSHDTSRVLGAVFRMSEDDVKASKRWSISIVVPGITTRYYASNLQSILMIKQTGGLTDFDITAGQHSVKPAEIGTAHVKINIMLTSFNHPLLASVAADIAGRLHKHGYRVAGPIDLPTRAPQHVRLYRKEIRATVDRKAFEELMQVNVPDEVRIHVNIEEYPTFFI